jgi:tetratricopeptide (TPR) repeat protein
MDLQNFTSEELYFDQPMSAEVQKLLDQAANEYGGASERLLIKAYSLAPENLAVLVGLYRYYYYQHRYQDALGIADRVMALLAPKIDFPSDWRDINFGVVAGGILRSFTLVRFYFFSLKAAGYLNLRLGRFELGRNMLECVVRNDTNDRIGARILLEVLGNNKADVVPFIKPNRRLVNE